MSSRARKFCPACRQGFNTNLNHKYCMKCGARLHMQRGNPAAQANSFQGSAAQTFPFSGQDARSGGNREQNWSESNRMLQQQGRGDFGFGSMYDDNSQGMRFSHSQVRGPPRSSFRRLPYRARSDDRSQGMREVVPKVTGNKVMAGDHGFPLVECGYTEWCYKHHHCVPESGCSRTDDVSRCTYPRPVDAPLVLARDYERLEKMESPKTHLRALQELSNFAFLMSEYTLHVPARDDFQEQMIECLDDCYQDTKEERFQWARSTFHAKNKEINVNAANLHHRLQMYTRHCIHKYCRDLLKHLHEAGLALGVAADIESHDTLVATVVGNYRMLQEIRSQKLGEEQMDLPIEGSLGWLWREFVDVVEKACQQFCEKVRQLLTVSFAHVEMLLSDTWFAPGLDFMMTGGFSPSDLFPRTTSLPNFCYLDIPGIEASMMELIASMLGDGNSSSDGGPAANDDDTNMG